ncbi:MAG TPA: CocE/NonD family hydrolase [Phenylobacterium sp.]|jgi:putative CocE/NonD family hydrolase|uniref:CocE/NonD family hydrolase n=1 Tax=Phenylobacterium sp. TaxID=1871053 RepID=UPI002CDC778F|nr:CocE/NonD family hydrolase [Phenylobacterium sp.]HXA40736.1 CocE/NonD family hydrolase [Phenylobacterium sp.]
MSHPASFTRRGLSRLIAAFTLAGAGRAAAAPDGPYEVVLESNIRVPMRDGVKLATDVYRPARGGKAVPGRFPAIMERTPYGRNVTSFRDITQANPKTPKTRAEVAATYVRQGYVVVFQDCRGRYDSEGEFVKYLSEGADGFDACRWLTAQPWSDGRIGTFGLSYAAHTQGALACLNPPGLKAMFLDCGGFANAYQDGIRQGGAFELKQVTWAYNLGLESPEAQKDPRLMAALKKVDLKAWFASMPWKAGHTPLSLIPGYEAYVLDQWRHGNFDGYWKQVGIYAEGSYDRYADAAMVHMSGWYDAYSRSTTDNYVALSKKKTGPIRLIMGPWTHGARSTTYSGDVESGPGSTLDALGHGDLDAQRLAWFDRHLKGSSKSDPDPPVRIFVMGGGLDGKGVGRKTPEGRLMHGGRWRAESAWPIADAKLLAYHLHADGQLSVAAPAAAVEPLSYDFDPSRPVPSIGGTITSGEPLMRGGGFDQREGATVYGSRQPYLPLEARPDVLVFQTAPLKEDVEVTGAIEAELWIASDGPDTDFTIKLIDVYPPSEDYPEGYALNLTDGILRCRYRDSWEAPAMMTPGQSYRIKVAAFPTSNLFKAGHRIRLDVSSSNFPHFDVNPNTGDPEGMGLTRRVARNTVFVDAGRPSHVVLPVIPRRG